MPQKSNILPKAQFAFTPTKTEEKDHCGKLPNSNVLWKRAL
ncbi:MAG: hypothetical protein QXW82_07630 [Candidatus Bathyarchaeia archaeon]